MEASNSRDPRCTAARSVHVETRGARLPTIELAMSQILFGSLKLQESLAGLFAISALRYARASGTVPAPLD